MRPDADVSDDAALGGRLRLRQPRRGHRFGHDAMLLAAAVAATAGERAVDLGAGVGAAGLALATRVPGLALTLVEIDPVLAALATENAQRNDLSGRVAVCCRDVATIDARSPAPELAPESFDHALVNPPFNDPGRHNASPDPLRRSAHMGYGLAPWLEAAVCLLRPQGCLTMILRAEGLADALAFLRRQFGGIVILPIYPRAEASAIRIVLSALKGGRGPLALRPGLVLNEGNSPTAAADDILRGGSALGLRDTNE
jgi:tRNA1(Val) A37 N6-methylase TrmN6